MRIAGSYHTSADGEEQGSARAAHVTVVALGDLGRSPRICYHALALADAGARVDLVGYRDTALDAAIERHGGIRVHALRSEPANAPRRGFVARGLARVAQQSVELLHALLVRLERPDVVLVQNPPAVPTLATAIVAARLRRARRIVDWHNFGYAMLATRLGADHGIVRVARAPVCALDYGPCLAETIRVGENGLLFRSAAELAEQLAMLFGGGADGPALLARLRAGTASVATERWHEAWAAAAAPLLSVEARR